MALRILIADDHEIIRQGLRLSLEGRAGWTICGAAAVGREAVEKATALKPDIVVMDITMPRLDGLEATRQIRKALPGCEVLVLTMHESEQLVHEVLAAGARGFVMKSDAGKEIVTAVERLARHEPYFTSPAAQVLLNAFLDPPGDVLPGEESGALTGREREVVQLIAEGCSSKEAAAVLGISDKTVETHRTNIMRKLRVHSISEIVRYAIRNHIIEA